MGDAKEPAAEFAILPQGAEMFAGGDERLLHEVEGGLFVADEFEDINIERQLVSAEEGVPSRRYTGTGLGHGQSFWGGHFRHFHQEECARRAKVQSG